MSAVLSGLSTSSTYYVTFYVGVRIGGTLGEQTPNITASTVTLSYGTQTLWTSVTNISDASGYMYVQTSTFTPATVQATFSFIVVSTVDVDHSILIDAVTISPTVAVPNATVAVGGTSTFESPVIGDQYDYNTPVSPTQPWSWSQGLGGRAQIGSPFDPPPPSTPPSGSQYAFLQTSPNGANQLSSTMSAVISGVSASTSYIVSFYWGIRAQQNTAGGDTTAGNQTESSFSVLVNGQVVYQSAQNVSDMGGWIYAQTVPWQPVSASNGQATISFYVTSLTLQDHTILFDDITVWLAGGVTVPSLQDFESPYSNYLYNPPVTAQQPWTWPINGGGVAHTGGPFDPPKPIQPPSNAQYAFLQTSPGGKGNATTFMSATLFNLSSSVSYTASFYYGVRAATTDADLNSVGNQTQSQMTFSIGGQQLWQSVVNISDQGGWTYVAPISFSGSGNVPILFSVTSVGKDDHTILVDALQLTTNQPLPTYYMQAGMTYNFENPSLAFTTPYQYNPPTSVFQPFTWPLVIAAGVRNGGGGLAAVGSPWDPPAPATPPSGSQYAFIQTSANSNAGLQLSNMTALAQLYSQTSYYMTFYYAARSQNNDENEPGWQTQSTLTVTVNGLTVWSSGANVTDLAGWMYAQTSTFPGVTGPDPVNFIVSSSSNDDHAILIDSITINVGTAPSLSSSTGGVGLPAIVFRQGGPIEPDTLYDFETPAANNPQYIYCPNVTSTPAQPWNFPLNPSSTSDWCLGGVAQTGGPFDPPPPTQAPNNIQVSETHSRHSSIHALLAHEGTDGCGCLVLLFCRSTPSFKPRPTVIMAARRRT